MNTITKQCTHSIANEIENELKKKKNKDKDIVISTRYKENKPSFILVGDGNMRTKHNKDLFHKSFDLIDEVMKMDADEKFAFKEIKDRIKYSHFDEKYIYQVKITGNDLGTKKTKFSRGFNKLKNKDLARRIKRSTYMINPLALIPNKDIDIEFEIYYGFHPREMFNKQYDEL